MLELEDTVDDYLQGKAIWKLHSFLFKLQMGFTGGYIKWKVSI